VRGRGVVRGGISTAELLLIRGLPRANLGYCRLYQCYLVIVPSEMKVISFSTGNVGSTGNRG